MKRVSRKYDVKRLLRLVSMTWHLCCFCWYWLRQFALSVISFSVDMEPVRKNNFPHLGTFWSNFSPKATYIVMTASVIICIFHLFPSHFFSFEKCSKELGYNNTSSMLRHYRALHESLARTTAEVDRAQVIRYHRKIRLKCLWEWYYKSWTWFSTFRNTWTVI